MHILNRKSFILSLLALTYGFLSTLALLLSSPTGVYAQEREIAYQSGDQIKFRSIIYEFGGIDDRSSSAINGWSIYLESGTTFTCGDFIIVDNPATTNTVALRSTESRSQTDPNPVLGPNCVTVDIDTQPFIVAVTSQEICSQAGGSWNGSVCAFNSNPSDTDGETTTEPPAGVDETEEGQTSCEDNEGEFVFFQCAIIRLAGGTISWMDERVRSALEVKPEYYENDDLKEAWANFRNIAYVLLIPTMLIMVIGTALGFQFLDAYTVKRAMPRMLAAIIFIALSYEICIFLIELVTIVGRGMAGLIAAPFGGTDDLLLSSIFSPSKVSGLAVGTTGILAGIAVIGVGAVSLGIIGSYLLVGAIGLTIIFAVLTLREMIIIFLLVLGPIAILSWIFPGNDKPWKLWWGTFWKLLILYPIIMGLLVMGRAFAFIMSTADASGPEGVFISFAKLVAYIGPFFLIPAVFKWVGGFFGNLAGRVNDTSRGVFDRQRKYRGDARKRNFEQARAGNRFKGGTESNLRGKLNKAIEGGTNIDKAGLNPLRMRQRMRTALNDHAHDEASEFKDKNAAFGAFKGDDAKLYAAAAEDRESIARRLEEFDADRFGGPENTRAREDAVEQILRAQRETSSETFQRARVRAQASTGTGYQRKIARMNADGSAALDDEGKQIYDTVFDSSEMLRDINKAYGNDRNGAGRALAEMRGALSNSGQIAGQAGFGTWAAQLESLHNDNSAANAELAHMKIMDDAADSVTPGQALYGKPTSAAALGASHARKIQAAQNRVTMSRQAVADARSGTEEQKAAARAQLQAAEGSLDATMAAAAGILDSMSHSATPQNASAFAKELNGVTIKGSGAELSRNIATGEVDMAAPDVTVRKMIEQRSNTPIDAHPEFHNRRREQTHLWDDEARRNAPRDPSASAGSGFGGGFSSGMPT